MVAVLVVDSSSAVTPPFPILMTSTPLTTVAEPGMVLEREFIVEVGGVGGDAVIDDAVAVGLREGGGQHT
jgi:hypothetical protein